MKTLCRYCVKKPVTVLMAVLIIIAFGIFSLTRMSLALFPNLNLPYAVVVTTYVGANPEQVEKEVTIPIEQQLVTLTNYNQLQSTSNEHYSMIMIEFDDNTNMDNAFLEMREALDSISFAKGVDKPKIMRITADMMPIVTASVSKEDCDLIETTKWVQNTLEPELLKIDGVAQVSYRGTADVVLDFVIDSSKTSLTDPNAIAPGLTNDQIKKIIEDTNKADGLIGMTLDSTGIKMLYIGDPTKSIEELKNLPIYYNEITGVVRLKDVLVNGEITFKNNADSNYNKINGRDGISISFQQDSSAELTTVVKNIKKAFDKIQKEDPTVKVTYILDQGEYVETSIGTVIDNLIQGALLAVIILLIFLLNSKPTLIVAVSIPVSVIATFVAMYFAGINLNIVSMGGLALGIGMLVDNSVVVIENIFRMIKNGKTKKEAAVYGAAEVAGAITASTLTTVAVFIPIMFLKGLAGSIFKEMALTVCFSLACSLIIALTVVPSAAAIFLKDKDDEVKETKLKKLDEKINSNKKLGYTVTGLVMALIATSVFLVCKLAIKLNVFYCILIAAVVVAFMIVSLISSRGKIENKEGKITKAYEKTIRWSINHKTIVTLGAIVLLVVSTVLAFTRGFALIPATDEGSVSGTIILEKNQDGADTIADELTQVIMDSTTDIDMIQTTVGGGNLMDTILGNSTSGNEINFTIALKDDREKSTKKNRQIIEGKVIEYLDKSTYLIAEDGIQFSEASSMASTLGTSGTMIYVEGSDQFEMEAVAKALVAHLENIEGTEKWDDGVSEGDRIVKITVKRDKAIEKGLFSIDFSNAVSLLYQSFGFSLDTAGQDVLKVNVEGAYYEISSSGTSDLNNLPNIPKEFFLRSIAVFDSKLNSALTESNDIGQLYTYNPNMALLMSEESEAYQAYKAGVMAMYGLDEEGFAALKTSVMNDFITDAQKLLIINPNFIYDDVNGKAYVVDDITDTTVYTVIDGKVYDIENNYLGVTVSSKVRAYVTDPADTYTEVDERAGFKKYTRNGKNRYILVTAGLKDGYNATKVGSKVTSAVNEFLKSDEYKQILEDYQNVPIKVYEQGENEQIMDVVKQLAICAVLAILLVYMIMCIQFQSLKYPLIIMGTIPLAFTGGFLLLFICGMELSMVALIGLVVLVGVVVNNGIVIVDYMNQLVEQGTPIKEAAVIAGKTRLRPIFMTALTTIFALLTMALGIGESAEIMQPLAVAAIGGLTYATLLTLLVVPSLYVMMSRKKIKKEEANNTNSDIKEESETNGEIATNQE